MILVIVIFILVMHSVEACDGVIDALGTMDAKHRQRIMLSASDEERTMVHSRASASLTDTPIVITYTRLRKPLDIPLSHNAETSLSLPDWCAFGTMFLIPLVDDWVWTRASYLSPAFAEALRVRGRRTGTFFVLCTSIE